MVLAEGLHKSFGRLEVLRGIDLEVARQEVVCIIGPSGSGKSTLLRCINHLEKINAGRLWVDGELVGYRQRGDKLYELREREICAKRAEIGMVFQQFNLFPHMTALENGPARSCPRCSEYRRRASRPVGRVLCTRRSGPMAIHRDNGRRAEDGVADLLPRHEYPALSRHRDPSNCARTAGPFPPGRDRQGPGVRPRRCAQRFPRR